jgi:hypothetical protein
MASSIVFSALGRFAAVSIEQMSLSASFPLWSSWRSVGAEDLRIGRGPVRWSRRDFINRRFAFTFSCTCWLMDFRSGLTAEYGLSLELLRNKRGGLSDSLRRGVEPLTVIGRQKGRHGPKVAIRSYVKCSSRPSALGLWSLARKSVYPAP